MYSEVIQEGEHSTSMNICPREINIVTVLFGLCRLLSSHILMLRSVVV